MDWNKQAYLGINELKGKLDNTTNCNTLILNERPIDGEIVIKFKTQGRRIQIILELDESVSALVKLDNYIIEATKDKIITANIDTYSGEHKLKVTIDNVYNNCVKITIIANGIRLNEEFLEPCAVDNINNVIYIRDSDSCLYSLNTLLDNATLTISDNSCISSINYTLDELIYLYLPILRMEY